MIPLFRPKTIKTILESAPAVIQGAGKLIQMIRERDTDKTPPEQDTTDQPIQDSEEAPLTLEGLNTEINRLEDRLQHNAESDVEQIKLIEQLARQNEVLAESLSRNYSRITVLTIISVLAIVFGLMGIILAVT